MKIEDALAIVVILAPRRDYLTRLEAGLLVEAEHEIETRVDDLCNNAQARNDRK